MSVDEARSVGKRVLVSDIPSHREQNPPQALFFNPHDRSELVEKLSRIWTEAIPGPDIQLELESRNAQLERTKILIAKTCVLPDSSSVPTAGNVLQEGK